MTDVVLQVGDRAICLVAAYEASRVAGVARLQPLPRHAARTAVTSAARRASARFTGSDAAGRAGRTAPAADPGAATVERREDGTVLVTVRVVTDATRPVRTVAHDVAAQVTDRLRDLAGLAADVRVNVVDVDA